MLDANTRAERKRWLLAAALISSSVVLYLWPPQFLRANPHFAELIAQIDYRIVQPVHGLFVHQIATVEFLAVVGAVFLVQLLIPARRHDRIISPNLVTDALWFVQAAVVGTFLKTVYLVWAVAALQPYVSGLAWTSFAELPVPWRFVIAFVVIEFMHWLLHLVLHKVPFLWQFHAVHHSQRELNLFSAQRTHPVEYFLGSTVMVLPLALLQIEMPVIAAYVFFDTWYGMIYHANIKSNYGPFKYFLQTPQSHRVHHALAPELRDRNFGHTLILWDWLFGTLHKDFDTYPEIGIDDPRFPVEPARFSLSLLWIPLVQQWYPLKTVAGWFWAEVKRLFRISRANALAGRARKNGN